MLRKYFIGQIEEVLDQTGELPEFDLDTIKSADTFKFGVSDSKIAEEFYAALGIVIGRTF